MVSDSLNEKRDENEGFKMKKTLKITKIRKTVQFLSTFAIFAAALMLLLSAAASKNRAEIITGIALTLIFVFKITPINNDAHI